MPAKPQRSSPPPDGKSSPLPPTDPLEQLRRVRRARRDTDAKAPVWSEAELRRIWQNTADCPPRPLKKYKKPAPGLGTSPCGWDLEGLLTRAPD